MLMLVARCMWRIHHHDHACSLGVHARQQCRCLNELLLHSIIASFESATILISTIACYCLHASCMLLRPSPVWCRVVISLPDLPGYCGRRSFWPQFSVLTGAFCQSADLAAVCLEDCYDTPPRFARFPLVQCLCAQPFWAVAVRYPVCF